MCKICGRGSCAEYFHSIEEQEAFEEAKGMDTADVLALVIEVNEYRNMEKWMEENSNSSLCDYYNRDEGD